MADYNVDTLHFPASDDLTARVFGRVSAEQAGWEYLNMVAMSLTAGQTFGITIEQYEYVAVVLSGVCDIRTDKGDFLDVGRRFDVFTGMPYAIYMPRNTEFEIEALTDDFSMASCWAATTQDHPIQLITPKDCTTEVIGGGNASYQMTTIIGDGFSRQRLTVREMYIPGGNWANYPPHKHDEHITTAKNITEAKLEEVLLHKVDKPHGFAQQRIYDYAGMDVTVTAKHNDIVIVPRGYHTMSSAPGYTTYILSVSAGSAQAHTYTHDPRYAWLPNTWHSKDPRLPIVSQGMEPYIAPDDEG